MRVQFIERVTYWVAITLYQGKYLLAASSFSCPFKLASSLGITAITKPHDPSSRFLKDHFNWLSIDGHLQGVLRRLPFAEEECCDQDDATDTDDPPWDGSTCLSARGAWFGWYLYSMQGDGGCWIVFFSFFLCLREEIFHWDGFFFLTVGPILVIEDLIRLPPELNRYYIIVDFLEVPII